jgi:hypothetical protein
MIYARGEAHTHTKKKRERERKDDEKEGEEEEETLTFCIALYAASIIWKSYSDLKINSIQIRCGGVRKRSFSSFCRAGAGVRNDGFN